MMVCVGCILGVVFCSNRFGQPGTMHSNRASTLVVVSGSGLICFGRLSLRVRVCVRAFVQSVGLKQRTARYC